MCCRSIKAAGEHSRLKTDAEALQERPGQQVRHGYGMKIKRN
jgi:hypothetical protein